MSDWLSPLRYAERILEGRVIALGRRLPPDHTDSELWPEFYRAVDSLVEVRRQLRPPVAPPATTLSKPRRV
jgi:hypothetical protein